MKITILSLFILMIFFFFFQGQTPAKDSSQDPSAYKLMIGKIRAGDKSINYGELRRAYVEWLNDGKGTKEAPNREAMVTAFNAKNYAKAVELGEQVVDYEFVNPGLLGAIAEAYDKLGNADKAAFFKETAEKARHGLYLSGDGKTAKTAYFVMSIDEEYRVMRGLGYSVSIQSLAAIDGQSYDILSGKDESGKSVELYFNICSFFGCSKNK